MYIYIRKFLIVYICLSTERKKKRSIRRIVCLHRANYPIFNRDCNNARKKLSQKFSSNSEIYTIIRKTDFRRN